MAIKPVSGEVKSQDINDNLSYLDSKLEQVNGGPLGSLGSVAELNQKYPNGANGFFIIDGHMYFWENNKWVDKGVYQARENSSDSIDGSKLTKNAVTIENSAYIKLDNLFNKNDPRNELGFIEGDKKYNHNEPYKISHPILVNSGSLYVSVGKGLGPGAKETLWILDSKGDLEIVIKGTVTSNVVVFNIPKKSFVRFNTGTDDSAFMCQQNDSSNLFRPYEPKLDRDITISRSQLVIENKQKWAIIGDSITDKNNDTTTMRYYDYINSENEYDLQILGVSGSGYARKNNTNEAFYQRVGQINEDVDFVTVFGSFNDINYDALGFGLGTINDVGTSTVCGCINEFFNLYNQKFPLKPIEIILPTPWEANYVGKKHSDDYVNVLEQIAIRNGAAVLDLYRHSGLRPFDPVQKALAFDSAGVHPNEKGHFKISSFIKNSLNSLFIEV